MGTYGVKHRTMQSFQWAKPIHPKAKAIEWLREPHYPFHTIETARKWAEHILGPDIVEVEIVQICNVLRNAINREVKYVYYEIEASLFELENNFDEELLLKVLAFEGHLDLIEGCACPHSKSPEDMLKSLAMQILHSHTGLKHLRLMKRAADTSNNVSSMRSIVRALIAKTREGK